VCINAINAGCFFGLNNNVETSESISFSGTECTNPINIKNIRALGVGIDDDTSYNNNNILSNLNNSLY
jgi:hypothetical protein